MTVSMRRRRNLADTIEMYAKNDQEELEMLSAVLSQHQDFSSPDLWKLLDSYTNIGMMSRIELLLPGDIVLTKGGRQHRSRRTALF